MCDRNRTLGKLRHRMRLGTQAGHTVLGMHSGRDFVARNRAGCSNPAAYWHWRQHIYLACPKTIVIFCAALSTQVKRQARRNRQPTCSAPDHGLGMAGPIYSVGVVRSISFGRCHRAPTVWFPELTQGCRYSLALGRKPPLINRDIFSSIPSGLR